MPIQVAVLDDYQGIARAIAPWETLEPDAEVTCFHDHLLIDGVVRDLLEGFEVIVAMRERTPFTAKRLASLPDLRLLVTTGMANASIDMEAARGLGITVCGTASLPSPTAELTWGLIIALQRNLLEEDLRIREGGWQRTIGPELAGRTLGILGLGNVGRRVARIAQAFEMEVIAWSENLTPEAAGEAGAQAVGRDELFERADVLTIHTRLSDRTRGLVGARELGLMKETAILVNTSRGSIVDEDALLKALVKGTIAGAALDVYAKEPLPKDHPLREAPRTLLSPHLGYVSIGTYEVMYRDAVEDIAAWIRGEPVRVLNGA
ncbi:MAG TPA: D-2-hydroxyacid dehydrogenase family protein [Solirubrobacteraceae bacterium]|nr:D-2-hydroxyacid dehydrogenase family protein [Solirubrobacteraceae bacterium]